MNKLTRDEREALTKHTDPDIQAFLMAVENGRIGVIYKGGRGNSRKPRQDGTLVSYAGTLKRLHEYLDGPSWQDVTERDLEDFLHRPLPDDGPRSMTTAVQYLSVLRNFYAYLMAYRRVEFATPDDNPSAFVRLDEERLKRAEDRLPVSDDQWMAVVGSPLAVDDRLALGLGYYVGLRREEIVTVAPHAIDPLRKRILFVDRKGGKTKTGLEYGELVGVLQDHRPEVADGAEDWIDLVEFYARSRHGEDTLVPGYGVKHAGQRLRDRLQHTILPGAGLHPGAFTPHALRHSFGTNLALAGVPLERIADQMSHSSTETTMRYINAAGQIAAWRKREGVTSIGGHRNRLRSSLVGNK